MKKIILVLCFASLAIAGCQKKIADTIDGQTVDQRLTAALTAYQNLLTQSPYGWTIVEYSTGQAVNQGAYTSGPAAAFSFYMQFNDSNQVTMFADFNSSTALTPKSSSYRLKATQRPSLIFDTYSYIELPCDPDPTISGSPFGAGLGWGTDFEFSFADNVSPTALGDTIHLTGNLNGASAVMVKATKAQHDAYYSGAFAANFTFNNIQNYFKRLTADGKTFELTPGTSGRVIDVDWIYGANTVQSASAAYYRLPDGIHFATPLQALGLTITGFLNIAWNGTTATATLNSSGTSGTIVGAVAPLEYDPNGPYFWYTAATNVGGLYLSSNGFHVDGVDDAFQLDTLTFNGSPFSFYVYYPQVINGGALDLFSPFFNSGYPDYLSATQPFTDTLGLGLVYFNLYTNGLTLPNAVNSTDSLEGDPNGFYLILKEDGTTYDQVITSDAKSWISWSFYP